ncbi:hypothetical protein [Arthrobacter sp. HY1533]|uniref:hypothetical protein n=1 Tax=Arthrobacter sp. HY1533 TaxID=2970919 RepID=UPI0022BA06A1|nr:hypothetical protein [Arthrobacter sp. HY1533]
MDQKINSWLVLAFAIPMPAVHVVLGLANLHKATSAWPMLTAMAICLALMATICWRTAQRTLPFPAALAVLAGVAAMDLLVTGVLPVGIHPGYTAWHNGAIQMLLVALAFRNRLAVAWFGMGLFAVLDFRASLAHGLPLVDALALVLTPVMWMVIATAVLSMLGRSRSNIAAYTQQSRESATRLAREHARSLYREQGMRELDQLARPALETIAAGNVTEAQRRELALLEAGLRDQIRGRVLATPEVLAASRAARVRGVKVDLLDDRKAHLTPAVLADAARQLVAVLERAQSGVVRARALPVGERPQVTILAFDGTEEQNETYAEIHGPLHARTGSS